MRVVAECDNTFGCLLRFYAVIKCGHVLLVL